MRIEALLFDLGRVLVDLDGERVLARWSELAGRPAGSLDRTAAARLSSSDFFHRHERGVITDEDFFAHVRRELGLDLPDPHMLDGWNAVFVGEMPGIRAELARAAGRFPLYLFSNTNNAHHVLWSERYADLLAPFRKVYVSHRLGVRKPDREAFLAVAADMGHAPGEILFFDDREENVAGAAASGLQAVLVRSSADIAAALDSLTGA